MRKPKFDNPEELEKKITLYFETIKRPDDEGNVRPPTLAGLALFLGTTRKTLCDYINNAKEGKGKLAECGELLVMAKAQIECYLEEKLISGYSRGLEFVLQNGYHGWGNKNTVTVSGEVDVEHKGEVKVAELSDEELIRRINVLQAKANELLKKEGVTDGPDGS